MIIHSHRMCVLHGPLQTHSDVLVHHCHLHFVIHTLFMSTNKSYFFPGLAPNSMQKCEPSNGTSNVRLPFLPQMSPLFSQAKQQINWANIGINVRFENEKNTCKTVLMHVFSIGFVNFCDELIIYMCTHKHKFPYPYLHTYIT